MKVLENNTGMSNVCLVPLSYIFHRGQGAKIYSLVMYECTKRKQVIPSKEVIDDGMYEGAIVLNPKTGIYVDDPIVVFDYSSLYPSSMIAENLSHESHILPEDVNEYIKDDKLLEDSKDLILNKIEIDRSSLLYQIS
jgi:DNA polymerase elongation subunit (family B)